MLTVDSQPLPETLRHVPERLRREFGEPIPHEHVYEAVSRAYGELAAEARVTSFLPILAERVARDRLRRRGSGRAARDPLALAGGGGGRPR